jgi:hypothetical protein
MPSTKGAAPRQEAATNRTQPSQQSTTASDLLWSDAHRFCCSCGQPVVVVAYGRCGTCLQEPLRACPCCGHDISALRDLEIRWAFRTASADVNAEWIAGRHAAHIAARDRVVAARSGEAL